MSGPDHEPTEKPTTGPDEARAEGQWMFRNWAGIAVVSVLSLLLMMIIAMQATGLIDVLAPIADTGLQQWAVVGVLVLVVAAIAGWSWRAILS